MVKKVVLVGILMVLLLGLQGPAAQADIIALVGPGQDYPNLNLVARVTIDNGINGNEEWSAYWSKGQTDWSFGPYNLQYTNSTGSVSSSADESVTVNYPGSSLHASGSGSAFSSTSNPLDSSTSSSGFTITFRPSVDCSFHLVGSMLGYVSQAGNWIPGQVFFSETVPGSNPTYLLPVYWKPVEFDLTGLLLAGRDYSFSIGVMERGGTLGQVYNGNWNFDLTVQSDTAQAVPVPPSLLLLGSGLLGLGATGLRRRKRS